MHMIAYISDCSLADNQLDKVIADIVATAKKENPWHRITGVLFYVHGKFLQIIEGDEQELRQLMKNIEADNRHRNVDYLIDTPVQDRGFGSWNMDSFNLDDGATIDAQILKDLTKAFEKSLVPRSDALLYYYRTLLRRKDD